VDPRPGVIRMCGLRIITTVSTLDPTSCRWNPARARTCGSTRWCAPCAAAITAIPRANSCAALAPCDSVVRAYNVSLLSSNPIQLLARRVGPHVDAPDSILRLPNMQDELACRLRNALALVRPQRHASLASACWNGAGARTAGFSVSHAPRTWQDSSRPVAGYGSAS